ncbi:DUF6788 family protein [Alkaliphilus sp. B6464]|uniref:DUF6788 family protein n=1 Tax=Alkaliphilus sp. B6464 TaxID=2731219 RepID=UPI001BAD2434|nr:DUF6788 family protein [Alkaliphilus sp. B6464]QUH22043.1 hypothetical protein HYG84_19245 [Alkaliphilus sp. B6464]
MNKLDTIIKEIEELEKQIERKFDNGLRGAIVDKYIKCGRDGCKCDQGYRHGPYPHIQFYDQKGVLRTIYIRKKLGTEYKEKIKENTEFRRVVKVLVRLYMQKRRIEEKLQKQKHE